VEVKDHSGQLTVVAFDESAQQILGISASKFNAMREQQRYTEINACIFILFLSVSKTSPAISHAFHAL
jgi:hypothetical protein